MSGVWATITKAGASVAKAVGTATCTHTYEITAMTTICDTSTTSGKAWDFVKKLIDTPDEHNVNLVTLRCSKCQHAVDKYKTGETCTYDATHDRHWRLNKQSDGIDKYKWPKGGDKFKLPKEVVAEKKTRTEKSKSSDSSDSSSSSSKSTSKKPESVGGRSTIKDDYKCIAPRPRGA